MSARSSSMNAPDTVPASDSSDLEWKGLYRVGGVSALVMAGCVVIQFLVFFLWPPPNSIIGWFTLFQNHRLVGLLDLDLLIVVDSALMIPMYLALYAALRNTNKSMMVLSTTLGLISLAAYFSSNPVFNMLALSDRYAAAATEAQRSLILSAGEAVFSMWTGTAFDVYYVLGSVAPVIIGAVMLQSRVFSRGSAYLAIVSNVIALGLFVPRIGPYISLFSVIGLEVWFVLVGLRLFALGKSESRALPLVPAAQGNA